MSYQMETAFITAIVSFITALSSIIFSVVKVRKEREERKKEFQTKLTQLESKFLHERVMQRYRTYPEVFRVLGAVRDVSDPNQEHFKSLLNSREKLLKTADALLVHLYGDAGLVMEFETRNALLTAWITCHLFQTNEVTLNQLIGYFYLARRWLRADLQIEDTHDVKVKLKEIENRFDMGSSNKKIEEAKGRTLWIV